MTVEVLETAQDDLFEGFLFYERQDAGLGWYFLESLYADLESLKLHAGIHSKEYRDFHRMLSKRFPFAVYYKLRDQTAFVYAVVDCRRKPAWIRKHLRSA